MAETITRGKTDLTFRDKAGVPYWLAIIPAPRPVTAEDGTIVGTDVVAINGVDYTTYRIQTGASTVDIIAAPAWYTARQDYVLNVGTNVQIVGQVRPYAAGYNLFIADSIWSSESTFTIRPYGW
jgi:hypothetical protein